MSAVLLAAGAGRRAGGPKALRRDADGTSWLIRSITVLQAGGCDTVFAVLGCERVAARQLLTSDPGMRTLLAHGRLVLVDVADWADGMSASFRAGLVAADSPAVAVLVHLVDLPDVSVEVVRRVLAETSAGRGALARAVFHGRPGHPVLIGADHLPSLTAELTQLAGPAADVGAQGFLARRQPVLLECGDVASGQDQDWLG